MLLLQESWSAKSDNTPGIATIISPVGYPAARWPIEYLSHASHCKSGPPGLTPIATTPCLEQQLEESGVTGPVTEVRRAKTMLRQKTMHSQTTREATKKSRNVTNNFIDNIRPNLPARMCIREPLAPRRRRARQTRLQARTAQVLHADATRGAPRDTSGQAPWGGLANPRLR